ncbi:putative signal peptide protein [Halorubrum sp. AJ67]|nr:putative signal peptide protein [Halorubrum sp. AJ67]
MRRVLFGATRSCSCAAAHVEPRARPPSRTPEIPRSRTERQCHSSWPRSRRCSSTSRGATTPSSRTATGTACSAGGSNSRIRPPARVRRSSG